ncbi:MAG: precorrin-3B C(17)-methyltransferase [Azospirillaceae bacterium]
MDALEPGTPPPAILVMNRAGLGTGRRIARLLPGATLHAPAGRAEGAAGEGIETVEPAAALPAWFTAERPIVGLCASGILIRLLAPSLGDKATEPPVLAVAPDGGSVVPLLGGHRGANRLARTLADALGGHAAITTGSEAVAGVALDDPPAGWRLENPGDHKAFAARLLDGAEVRVEGMAPPAFDPLGQGGAAETPLTLAFGEAAAPGGPDRLVYRPATLALGVGCARSAEAAELDRLVMETLGEVGLPEAAIAGVFSLDLKEDEPAVEALAARLGVPVRVFGAARLEAETPRLAEPSEAVFREVGCHGVAEAAALAAAGPDGALVVTKRKSLSATCAVARAPAPIDPLTIGRARGRLSIVGTGPGAPAWRTPAAEAAVAAATDLVGYGLYLDLLGPLAAGKRRHARPLGEEIARARLALDLAAEGRRVALVSSGDPGIYAMASLVYELLDADPPEAWRRVAVETVPGISALQAAAARVGAPLGHDFCAVSLSDLLTPWTAIESRLRAAADGDFVVALYNPVSARRRVALDAAAAILGARRPPDTPVVLARSLGRPDETIRIIDLAELTADHADMLTVVLVGSSRTRRVARRHGGAWVYTPRGYPTGASAKPEEREQGPLSA